jgi:hypothetical protein
VFPHTVSVFNTWEDAELNRHYNITILRGVFLDVSQGTNIAKTGLSDADKATLYIPLDVAAESTTGDSKAFAEPKVFYNAEGKNSLWTLDTGGESNSTSTYFVKGEVTEEMSLAALKKAYDNVFDVSTVDVRDFGSLQHWMVGGR